MNRLPKDIARALSHDPATIRPEFKKQLKTLVVQGENVAQSQSPKLAFLSNKFIIPASVALLLVALVGAGTYNYGTNKSEKASLRNVQLPSDLAGVKSMDEIRTIAGVGLIGDVKVIGVELKQEEGQLVYKVQFSDGTFKMFDAKTGDLIANAALEVQKEVPAGFVASVTIDTARTTAQATFPSKTIVKIELESENAIVVYSVRFSDGSRVDVSATDGSVVRSRDAASATSGSGALSDDDSKDEQENEDSDHSSTSGSGSGKAEDSSKSGKSGSGSDDSKSGSNRD